MSMKGSLEDVSVPDVLQFVHLGNRSGRLKLEAGGRKAEIGFHRGRIISARAPGSKRLGELLVDAGTIQRKDLEEALAAQGQTASPRALGQLLIERGLLTPDRLREVVERHVEETVMELVLWTTGDFEFDVEEVKPIDGLSVSPGDLLPDIHLNTQMVLLEATRIFDERGRDAPRPADGGLLYGDVETTKPGALYPTEITSERGTLPALQVQVVSNDATLVALLGPALGPRNVVVVKVTPAEAGVTPPGEPAPIVVVDLRRGGSLELLTSLRRSRPRAAPIAIMAGPAPTPEIYAAGALAALPASPELVLACVLAFVRSRQIMLKDVERDRLQVGTDEVRRRLGEFRSSLVGATVSVNLMNLISSSVERAVLFVVARAELRAIGAFGVSSAGQPLAAVTRGFRIALEQGGVLAQCVQDGTSRKVPYATAGLPPMFAALLGRPALATCAVFPLLGTRRVVAAVYADNGQERKEIDDVGFLELATSQAGVFYENELLRRRIGGNPGAPPLAVTSDPPGDEPA